MTQEFNKLQSVHLGGDDEFDDVAATQSVPEDVRAEVPEADKPEPADDEPETGETEDEEADAEPAGDTPTDCVHP